MNGNFLEQKDLRKLRKILQSELGLEVVDEDYLYEAAVSCIKFTAGKILRQANLSPNDNDNGG